LLSPSLSFFMFQWVFLWACVVYLHAFVEFKKNKGYEKRDLCCLGWIKKKRWI
jgi:hypothetical protein